ncbi:unnamed protein product [Lactuca virosa]|uniref:Uncharacterized protein n=1 Tax=Lactuca virosa TaxID=75947 RepID=A0AAU9M5J2_9ASTR|nr:unnamed protein product [Lactuca virosa]
MENFQTTFNSNTTAANESLKSLDSLFKSEKAKLQEIRTGLKTDHEAFQTSISSQIYKLQDELANEINIKDSLALKTEEVKVLSVKLEASEKQSYVQEIGYMDVEIAAVLRKKPSVVRKESPKDFAKLKLGKIYSGEWFVVYQARERTGADFHRG